MNIYELSDNRCGVVGSYCLKDVHLVLLRTRKDNLFVSIVSSIHIVVHYDIVMNFNKTKTRLQFWLERYVCCDGA